MQEKSVTLTPNNRLSRHLQKQFCNKYNIQKNCAWYSKKILPLSIWLTECWNNYHDPRVLLSEIQERILWQKIIIETLGEKLEPLTDLAINFHNLVTNWQINDRLVFSEETEDLMIFHALYKKFKEHCLKENLVTQSELPSLIIPYIRDNQFTKITFSGFDEYTPQIETLILELEKTSCKILRSDPNDIQNSTQKRIGCEDLKHELNLCAMWAKKIITSNPNKTIGIVIPNLIALRPKVFQTFTNIIENPKKINISAGIPLNTIPIIDFALELLSQKGHLEPHNISKLLLSPYITGSERELGARAIFNQQLQQLTSQQLNFNEINNLAIENKNDIPILVDALKNFHDSILPKQRQYLYNSEWLELFTETLKIFGWPGENHLTNIETSAIDSFTKALQKISSADLITGKISYKKSIHILREIIANTTVQSEANIDAPINIIGSLEATGINFDHLWIMGMDQESWPPTPKPNPFIPITIQKKLSLPHSSSERELDFCKTLIKRYRRSAGEVIFSYVEQVEDHSTQPSFLISDISEISQQDLNLNKNLTKAQKIYQNQKLEQLIDITGPALSPNELSHTGSRMVELQSLCPFRAFSEFRLLAKEPQKPTLGINKMNRGILIHSALEKFWLKVKTQNNLCTLTTNELKQLLEGCTEQALNKLNLPKDLYRLEQQSLLSLLAHWIEIEKNRTPFKVIAIEKSLTINLASIPIKLRIDRVDELEGGKQLLIDYKTGKLIPSIFDLFGSRPKSPQLLLYSLAINAVEGLALAQINVDSFKFKELSLNELIFGFNHAEKHSLPQNEITWQELIKYWENILIKIATDFASGKASPTPLSAQVCSQCSFGPICRVSK